MDGIFIRRKLIFPLMLAVNFAVIMLCYANYIFTVHYSADSFSVMLNLEGAAENSLRNGRLTSGVLYFLMDRTGLNITVHLVASQLMCAVSLTLFVTVLLFDFLEVFEEDIDYSILCIMDIGFLLLVINPNSMSINFFYVENSALYAVSNLLLLLPVHVWCHKELNYKRVAASFLLLVVALDRYQVFIEFYIGIGLCYSYLKYRLRTHKLFMKEYIVLMLCGGTACLLNVLQMKLLQYIFGFEAVSRAAVFHVGLIIENVKTIVRNQWNIWYSTFGLLPKGYLLLLLLIICIGIIQGKIQKEQKGTAAQDALAGGVLLTIWVMSFSPLFLTGQLWLAPRTYWGMYTAVLFFVCVLTEKIKGLRRTENIYIGILSCFLAVMMIRLGEIQVNTIISNNIERNEMESLVAAVCDYENETGNNIETIYYQYDSDTMYAYYDRVKFTVYENNCRIAVNEWGFEYMMRYYLGRDMEICMMNEGEYVQYFDNRQWDRFDADEQIRFDGNRAYIAVY